MMASSIIPVKGFRNQFAVGLEAAVKVVQWDGRSPNANVIRNVFSVNGSNNMNYAAVGPNGRLYAGTFGAELCSSVANSSLYSFSRKAGVQTVFTGMKMNLGFAWYAKKQKFYYLDSCQFRITEFDWDPKTGMICKYCLDVTSWSDVIIVFFR